MFKIGDMAVYPTHGVGIIESIESKEISGDKQTFYVLRVLGNGMTIMVPTDNADTVGLRDVISKSQITRIYKILKNRSKDSEQLNGHQSWNKRYREYSDKLKSGDIFEVANVLKDINLLQNDKDLSFGEKRIMDSALSLLVKEISIAKNLKEESITKEIDKILTTSD
ncbi:MAG: CarD family transcriptional regulator [Deltaproteobacteria bacterium]|nr:CarD family transcriptional regulator [Deltaproteobacteria bacterium]